MPELKRKTFDFELKQLSEDGTGTARIATLNVTDKDGDVARPGDFGEQTAAVMPAHSWQNPMLGKARISEEGNEVLAAFKLNLKSDSGREWYEVLKFDLENPPAIQEWSYGYDAPDFEMGEFQGERVRFLNKPGGAGIKVHEISPVLLGAGENTGTLNIKGGDKRATPQHHSATNDSPWSAATNRKRVRTDEPASYYNGIYAWRDPEGDTGAKGSWKFIHHFVDEDGKAGAASTRACSNGIAVLNGARGGTTVPDTDRKGIYKHIAGHLKDADLEPPDLKQVASGKQFAAEITETMQAAYDLQDRVQALSMRLESVKTLRESEGRELSVARVNDLKDTLAAIKEAEGLEEFLAVPDPDADLKEKALQEAAKAERRHFLNKASDESTGEPIRDFEYLIHHIENVDGVEEIHHCRVYDHLGNLFIQEHLVVGDKTFHVITGLEPTQEVAWSNEEAEEAGITPKKMRDGMTLEEKAKEW